MTSHETPTHGPARDAPNSLQRWLLAESPVVVPAAAVAAFATLFTYLFLFARGARLSAGDVVLALGIWFGGTAAFTAWLTFSGWSRSRGDRIVKYVGRRTVSPEER